MGMYKHSDIKGNSEKAREKGRLKKGCKHKTTIVKEKLRVTEIEDLRETVIKNFDDFCKSKDEKLKLLATEKVAKYIFPQKREISGGLEVGLTLNVNVASLNEDRLKEMFKDEG